MSPENQKLAGRVAGVFRAIVQHQLLNKLSGDYRVMGSRQLPPSISVVHVSQLAHAMGCANCDELLVQYTDAFQVLKRFELLQYGADTGSAPGGLQLSTNKPRYFSGQGREAIPIEQWYFYINDRGREFIHQMTTDAQVLQYLGMFRTNTSAAHG